MRTAGLRQTARRDILVTAPFRWSGVRVETFRAGLSCLGEMQVSLTSERSDIDANAEATRCRLRPGRRFSSADVLSGGALGWMTMFERVPATPELPADVERTPSRPAAQCARAKDAELLAARQPG